MERGGLAVLVANVSGKLQRHERAIDGQARVATLSGGSREVSLRLGFLAAIACTVRDLQSTLVTRHCELARPATQSELSKGVQREHFAAFVRNRSPQNGSPRQIAFGLRVLAHGSVQVSKRAQRK